MLVPHSATRLAVPVTLTPYRVKYGVSPPPDIILLSCYCTILYCTVLYCTVLYCTVLYCTVLYCTILYCNVLYCTVLYCTVLYCTVLYCTVLYCTVLYCTVLYCTVLYCTVLYCIVLILYCKSPSEELEVGGCRPPYLLVCLYVIWSMHCFLFLYLLILPCLPVKDNRQTDKSLHH